MACNPRMTSRCRLFGATPSASKLNSLHSHYSEAYAALCNHRCHDWVAGDVGARLCCTCASVLFQSKEETDAPTKNSRHKTAVRRSPAHLARKMPGGILV